MITSPEDPPALRCCPEYGLPGDVSRCVICGTWHHAPDGVFHPITPERAGELARAPMDPYQTIAALDRAAQAMELDP